MLSRITFFIFILFSVITFFLFFTFIFTLLYFYAFNSSYENMRYKILFVEKKLSLIFYNLIEITLFHQVLKNYS